MLNDEIIANTETFVKTELSGAEGGHDWFHTERVWKNTLLIAETEKCNELVVQLGALLHDVADSKFHAGDEEVGATKARHFLQSLGVEKAAVQHVENIVRHISFKGGNQPQTFTSPELLIVQDADRLDALGAVGIARAFNYGGFTGRKLYDPSLKPNLSMDKETYKKSTSPTINHFYEKLLLLKDKMNTAKGKLLAEERHQFMESFLQQFYKEWNG